jgi:hypothetical protein
MMNSVRDIYEQQIEPLPPAERLHLARLIMDGLADSASRWLVEAGDAWSDQESTRPLGGITGLSRAQAAR